MLYARTRRVSESHSAHSHAAAAVHDRQHWLAAAAWPSKMLNPVSGSTSPTKTTISGFETNMTSRQRR
ncbi:hypothetical protein CLAFUW4_04058 [Fulvia fulva]|uniref:Uncharacterized protein n=1 Tax=Passalora fulva TaxID=5499 RepID=A0A9Q8LED8_PASFU|nr:uncharacterized protein CLAFUR5_04022 [Fulvia fulva]KAK4626824.1 hypothetical protein CLAFUR4_04044 [Fulvia fulva]KAK4627491.1 hypothetical protein CLAFUR0_04045 [Fulvia fulva]UJO15881.1 hypothetical protein CLAFUR5_04022 [Fulvia fulva]WPV14053.1 hypothetical protein CLAFUW4_04058 [Fulvia fulva]WPV28785.1 hypothetical protein CLAFUW7_04047 [Fulvia fulva]